MIISYVDLFHFDNVKPWKYTIHLIYGPYPKLTSNDFFRNLAVVDLHCLPPLTSICRGTTPFPCLETISVTNCESLRKLPFNSESAKKLNAIKGSAGWWNRLEWEDEATKHVFGAKFREHWSIGSIWCGYVNFKPF